MKPLRLEMRNFLSYRHEVIGLSDLSYASIVGENGSGKSSISGALGWVIFGTARFASGRDDSIVNDESSEARVVLDFEDRYGDVYRIDRFRSKKGKGKTELKFYARQPDGDWKQLGEHTISSNQSEINRIIGMNEDAFYSLVIMDQSAGGTRFINADVHQRRGILLSMEPQLARYSDLERKATTKLKETTEELKVTSTRLSSVADRIEDTNERIAKLGGGVPEDVWERTHPLEREFLPQKVDFEASELELTTQIGVVDDEIDALTRQVATANSTLESAEREMSSAKAKVEDDVDAARQRARVAEEDLRRLRRLTTQHEEATADLARYEKEEVDQLAKADTAAQAASLAAADLDKIDAEIDKIDVELDRLEDKRRQRADESAAVRSALEDLKHRRDGLHDHDTQSGKCWVCESDLPAERAEQLLAEVQSQIQDREASLEDLTRRLGNIDDGMDRAEDDLKSARRRAQQARADKDRGEADQRRAEDRSQEATTQIKRLQRSLGELTEDLSQLDGEQAAVILREVDAEVSRIRSEAAATVLAKLQERIDALDDAGVSQLQEKLQDLRRRRRGLGEDQTALARRAGAKRESEQLLESLNEEHTDLRTLRSSQAKQVERLTWLVNAFAPKGIPSMLLDEVLAAIEDEQNNILNAMPAMEGMQVEFRQGRANKSNDGTKDTLDIVVHLPSGQERYIESFSYGQKTKLALSNIFAMIAVFNSRHGNLVRYVLADEFLSALDEESIPVIVDIFRDIVNARLVESLNLVTHDPRLMEALPQQLVVEMTPEGSKAHARL